VDGDDEGEGCSAFIAGLIVGAAAIVAAVYAIARWGPLAIP
jgi:hypothetical protein